jgi:transcriptional antiterminator
MSALTTQQLEAVAAMSRGVTLPEIAKKLKISIRTLQRWAKLPEFAAALSQIQAEASHRVRVEVVDDVALRVKRLVFKSLNSLESVLDNVDSRNSDRIAASKVLLSYQFQIENPPRPVNEITALKVLVEANFFSTESLKELQEAYDGFLTQSQSIFSSQAKLP